MRKRLPDKWKEWSVLRQLGKGACGAVYLLEQDGQQAAVKEIRVPEDHAEFELLLREYMSEAALKQYFQDMANRLGAEIRIMMELKDHPNIVSIYDYEIVAREDGFGFSLYILMEYLTSLPRYQERHFLKEADYIRLGIELCCALEYCHEKEVLHRDIKPDNIFMTEDGHAKLGDFGMACYLDHNKRYMSIKGSTSYMAPEVFGGRTYDHRADQYSLALMIYRELNHGREPFVSLSKSIVSFEEKEAAVKERLSGKKLPPPEEASQSHWKILRKALQVDPNERYDSIASMKRDLIQLSEGKFRWTGWNRRQRRKLYTIMGTGTVCLVGVLAFSGYGRWNRIRVQETAERLQKYTVEFDEKLQKTLQDRDYAAFSDAFQGYSEEDFEQLCDQCFDKSLVKTKYFELASSNDMHYVEMLHYNVVGAYPDPESRVEASQMMYTVLSSGEEVFLTAEDGELIRTLLYKMPKGYQEAVAAGRNTEEYVFAHHWQDQDLVFDGVVGFEVTALWQNEDRSVTAQILIMNGTEDTRFINDMDYCLLDERLGLIAEGNCDENYEAAPGTSINFEIRIPAESVLTGWNEWSHVEILFEPNVD